MESPISVETFAKCWNEVGKNPNEILKNYGLENEYPELMIVFAVAALANDQLCHHFTLGFLFCLYCIEQEKVDKEIKELERISNGS